MTILTVKKVLQVISPLTLKLPSLVDYTTSNECMYVFLGIQMMGFGFFTKHEEQVLKTIYPICFI